MSLALREAEYCIYCQRQAQPGVATMPPTNPTSSVITDRLTRALGEAVIRVWSNLPQEVLAAPLASPRARSCPPRLRVRFGPGNGCTARRRADGTPVVACPSSPGARRCPAESRFDRERVQPWQTIRRSALKPKPSSSAQKPQSAAQPTTEGGRAKADYVAAGHAIRAKTARLKQLRLAKEATDKNAEAKRVTKTKKRPT
jgi:hypothetical protein